MTGPLVAAIEATWAAIQSRHPDVPDVVLTLGNGSTRPGQLTLGHFHAGKWATRDTEAEAAARLPELFVGGEGLAAGPRELLGTLLHEAAHGVAAARGIKDTSRQGRYHNTRYRDLAVELGLTVERDLRIGWSLTIVPDSTADLYSEHIAQLGEATRAHRLADAHSIGRGTTSNNGLTATCECDPPRKIRLSRNAYDTGPVICGVCESEFSAPDTTTDTSTSHEGRARMTTDDRSQQTESPMVIEYLTDPPSVADQVEPGAQLRWLTYLYRGGATREQVDTPTEPLLARLDRATAAVTARETEHDHAARLAIESYRRDRAAGLPAEQARHDAVSTAATLAAALHHPDDPRETREAELLAAPVTTEDIDTAPTPALRDALTRTVAAQQALTTLRDSHASTAADVIGLYHEGQDNRSYDPDTAQHEALAETRQGVRAVFENAYYEQDFRAQQRRTPQADPDRRTLIDGQPSDRQQHQATDDTATDRGAQHVLHEQAAVVRARRDDGAGYVEPGDERQAGYDKGWRDAHDDIARRLDQLADQTRRPVLDVEADSHAVHSAPPEHQPRTAAATTERTERDRDEDDRGRGDAVIDSARAAVTVLAALRRHQDARRTAEAARTEQLNRWHHDDHRATSTARASEQAPARGGRAICGGGPTR